MHYTSSPHSPTPESLIPRSDSKNPATTCKGITSSGRPCRRSLASPTPSPRARRSSAPSVIDSTQDPASAYCWQHKDQAMSLQSSQNAPIAPSHAHHASQPQRRTSTDTLIARFSGLDVASSVGGPRPARPSHTSRPARPSGKHKKPPGFWASLCCAINDDDDDYVEIVRHKRRTQQQQQAQARPEMATSHSSNHLMAPRPTATRPSVPHMPASAPAAPGAISPTQNLMRSIPPTLDAKTTANLLTELSKPISAGDEEGYIYIFWLTPESRAAWKPTDADAESLLDLPTSTRPRGTDRRSSAVKDELLRAHSVVERPGEATRGALPGGAEKRKILLKIGRASNVHRRMSEWTRQCGYELSLIRVYPYVPSSQLSQGSPVPSPRASPGRDGASYPSLAPPSPAYFSQRPQTQRSVSAGTGVRKVPFSHRVERLVHLELADARVTEGKCTACGRVHKEWFEVEASRKGIKGVDEVVRRWVAWAESVAAQQVYV